MTPLNEVGSDRQKRDRVTAPKKKQQQKNSATSRWVRGDVSFDDLDPREQIAHTIVFQFGDLSPSVERIMSADLTPGQRLEALNLFQISLEYLDDPNRDPRQAIESARATTD